MARKMTGRPVPWCGAQFRSERWPRHQRRKRSRYLVCASVGAVAIWLCASITLLAVIDTNFTDLNKSNELFNANISTLVATREREMEAARHRQREVAREKEAAREEEAATSLPKFPINHRSERFRPLSDWAISQCHKALWHTLDTTTAVLPHDETFVITGDIKDLWLRDSAAQVHPLLLPGVHLGRSLVQTDARLERVVSGLILKTARLIRFDPYANAFRREPQTPKTRFEREELGRHGYIATWNYELDSACYFMRMLYFFYRNFPSHPVLREREVKEAVSMMVDVWISEQRHEEDAYPKGELFDCVHCGKPYRYNPKELKNGKGTATNSSAGLTWSGFRPSDDPCVYGYLIPSNMFAVVVLGYMIKLSEVLWADKSLTKKARQLRAEIDEGIKTHGIVKHKIHGEIYAYEVDALGHSLLADDANVPSLLSIPYLGYKYDETIFANTKRFILSKLNPTYHQGKSDGFEFAGVGSPHTNHIPSSIWPMAMIMEGLISNNATDKVKMVEKLLAASAGTGWMHESFSASNPRIFSRSWFCWPDSLFAELIMSLTEECPKPERGGYKVFEWSDKFLQGSAFDSSQPKQQSQRKQTLAVISVCNDKQFNPAYIASSLANKQAFCDKWGAACILSKSQDVWEKFHQISHALGTTDADWIMWLDCDAAFTNLDIDWHEHLRGYLDSSKVLLASTYKNSTDLGVMFVPNNKLAGQFMDELYETR